MPRHTKQVIADKVVDRKNSLMNCDPLGAKEKLPMAKSDADETHWWKAYTKHSAVDGTLRHSTGPEQKLDLPAQAEVPALEIEPALSCHPLKP